MIKSFKDRHTENVWRGKAVKRFASIRKLDMLNSATSIDDLRAVPGNRLEALSKDRKGQHSIRINDQFRICFVWTEAGPEQVEIVDYH